MTIRRIRRGLTLAAVGAAIAGTVAVTPSAAMPYDVYPGPAAGNTVRAAQGQPGTAAEYVPIPRQFTPLGVDRQTGHSAFPAAAKLPDGRVVLMWRESDGHLDLDGGRIMRTVGDPIADTWAEPTEVVVDGGETGVTPHTGPSGLSYIDGKLWLTYFFWHNGKTSGARVASSTDEGLTFGPSVRVDGGRPWAAVGAPMVKWGNQYVVPWYGRNEGESYDTVWLALSSDGGQTWTTNRYVNALGANKHVTEPWVIVRGSKLIILYRDGVWSNLAMRESPDTGTTWPAPRAIATNATANSAAVWTSGGNIYVIYRHTQTRDAMLLTSKDGGDTWQSDPVPLVRAPANLGKDSLGMVYGAPVDLAEGVVFAAIAVEGSLDKARVVKGFL